jgi:hypothetical protein
MRLTVSGYWLSQARAGANNRACAGGVPRYSDVQSKHSTKIRLFGFRKGLRTGLQKVLSAQRKVSLVVGNPARLGKRAYLTHLTFPPITHRSIRTRREECRDGHRSRWPCFHLEEFLRPFRWPYLPYVFAKRRNSGMGSTRGQNRMKPLIYHSYKLIQFLFNPPF